MTDRPSDDPAARRPPAAELVDYQPGARWWAVLFGPAFGALGLLSEYLTGPANPWLWLGVAAFLAAVTALWIAARRVLCTTWVSAQELCVGGQRLPVARIRAVDGLAGPVAAPETARVLGQSWTVPKRFDAVPLRLDDDTVVLAWARDGERLREALRAVSHCAHE